MRTETAHKQNTIEGQEAVGDAEKGSELALAQAEKHRDVIDARLHKALRCPLRRRMDRLEQLGEAAVEVN